MTEPRRHKNVTARSSASSTLAAAGCLIETQYLFSLLREAVPAAAKNDYNEHFDQLTARIKTLIERIEEDLE
jgi:hypothetical protein